MAKKNSSTARKRNPASKHQSEFIVREAKLGQEGYPRLQGVLVIDGQETTVTLMRVVNVIDGPLIAVIDGKSAA